MKDNPELSTIKCRSNCKYFSPFGNKCMYAPGTHNREKEQVKIGEPCKHPEAHQTSAKSLENNII